MNQTVLTLPERAVKPRTTGLTMVIDGGIPLGLFSDQIELGAEYIDYVKFGWGTSVVTNCLREKIGVLDSTASTSTSAGRCSRSSRCRAGSTTSAGSARSTAPARRGVQRHDRDVQRREGRLHP